MSFDECFTRLMGHEGAYSNNPADPGGETMWGITKRVAVENGYTGAMADLRQDQAMAIARSAYWLPVKGDSLPEGVAFDVFDGAYNSGVGQSVRWLQRALGVADDGVPGPVTLLAANNANGADLSRKFNGQRLMFMTQLSTWPTFGKGWARRIANNLMG